MQELDGWHVEREADMLHALWLDEIGPEHGPETEAEQAEREDTEAYLAWLDEQGISDLDDAAEIEQ